MKKTLLPMCIVVLSMVGAASAQTFMDYVKEMKGDTAVIKDYTGMGSVSNSISNALNADTNRPADRVYELEANGYYPITANPTTSASGVVIVGSDPTPLVNNQNAASAPPIICGSTVSGGTSNSGGINYGGDLTIKNCAIIPAASDGTLGWAFLSGSAPNCRVILDNDLFEHTRWVFVQSNTVAGTRLFINNCYFVNMSGQPCRRNGGVYDNVNNNTDTIWVTNSTHVMAEGSMYKFRNFQIGKLFFNHNTFVNCAGSIFESLGYESNLTLTNNIFVNSNLQPTSDSVLTADVGEVDPDNLPTGLVNCAALPDTFQQVQRKILVDRNVVYWDPRFSNMDSILDAQKAWGETNWVSQMITMNSRTQSMFDDSSTYPYLTEGKWYNELPKFVDPSNLLTTEADSLKAFAMATVSSNASPAVLADWRVVSIETPGDFSNYVYSDWPIPINLAYTDSDLMTGGTMGEPVGDLNWFPAQKAGWNEAAENTTLENMLQTGTLTAVEHPGTQPRTFALSQNYPNPFNPSTIISFSIPKAGYVSLKVYSVLGQEIATLVNGFRQAQTYSVEFGGTGLASGIYFYTIKYDNQSISKKMLLLK